MTAITTVTATFSTAETLTIQLKPGSGGSGTITSTNGATPAVNCALGGGTTSCTYSYIFGTPVNMQEAPNGASVFANWSGGACSGNGATCNVTMNSSITVIAEFDPPSFTLTLNKTGTGAANGTISTGTITAPASGPTTAMNCGASCSTSYFQGTVIQLTQSVGGSPSPLFTGWSNGCSGAGACSVTLNTNTTVTANFQARNNLTVNVTGPGTVTSAPAGITNCTTSCTAAFTDTTNPVALTPSPAAQFLSWSGCTSVSGNVCNVNMNAAHTVTATFGNPPVITSMPAPVSFPATATPVPIANANAKDSDGNLASFVWTMTCSASISPCPALTSNASGTLSGGVAPVAVPGPTFTPNAGQGGSYTLTLKVTDSTNLSVTSAPLVDITATPPTAQVTNCPVGAATTTNCVAGNTFAKNMTINFNATDPETPVGPFTFTCTLTDVTTGGTVALPPGSCVSGGSSSVTYSSLTVGHNYKFTVTAKDGGPSNLTGPAATFTWSVIPPSPLTVTLGAVNTTNNQATITFTGTDPNGNGGSPILYYTITETDQSGTIIGSMPNVACATWPSCTFSFADAGGGGNYTATLSANDSYSPVPPSNTLTVKWFVPYVTILTDPNTDVNGAFTFSASECSASACPDAAALTASMIQCKFDGTVVACGGPNGSYTPPGGLTQGSSHALQVTATDGQGNVTTQLKTYVVTNIIITNPASTVLGGESLDLNSANLGTFAGFLNAVQCVDQTCATKNTYAYQPGQYPSVILDGSGNPHIASSPTITVNNSPARALQYAEYNGSSWSSLNLAQGATITSMASDVIWVNGEPMVFYPESGTGACGSGGVGVPVCLIRAVRLLSGGGTGCPNINGVSASPAWDCKVIDRVLDNSGGSGYSTGVAAYYQPGDLGPRVAYGLYTSYKFLACTDLTCTNAPTIVTLPGLANGDANVNGFAYVRKGTMDHVLVRYNCSSVAQHGTECSVTYLKRDTSAGGDTTSFSTATPTFTGSHTVASISFDVNASNDLEYSWIDTTNTSPTIFYGHCTGTCSSQLGTVQVDSGGVSGTTTSFKLGTDARARFIYNKDVNGGGGVYYAKCKNLYCQ